MKIQPFLTAILIYLCIFNNASKADAEYRWNVGARINPSTGVITTISVSYGFTGKRVDFVVIENGPRDFKSLASVTISGKSGGSQTISGFIRLPDGTKPDLPTAGRIYEIISGKFTSAPIDFTHSQLEAYIDSFPNPPTIEGLRLFTLERH